MFKDIVLDKKILRKKYTLSLRNAQITWSIWKYTLLSLEIKYTLY